MLTLTEIQESGQVSYQLSGDVGEMRQLTEGLVAAECAQIAALLRQTATATQTTIAGKPTAAVAFKPGTSGVPDALIDAAERAGIQLNRSTQGTGPEASIEPEG